MCSKIQLTPVIIIITSTNSLVKKLSQNLGDHLILALFKQNGLLGEHPFCWNHPKSSSPVYFFRKSLSCCLSHSRSASLKIFSASIWIKPPSFSSKTRPWSFQLIICHIWLMQLILSLTLIKINSFLQSYVFKFSCPPRWLVLKTSGLLRSCASNKRSWSKLWSKFDFLSRPELTFLT